MISSSETPILPASSETVGERPCSWVSSAVADSLGMLDDALEGVEYRESLKPLLEQLPAREKKILMLRFFGGMTQSQIAAELGISQMHVSRLLARTLAQLRQGLLVDE